MWYDDVRIKLDPYQWGVKAIYEGRYCLIESADALFADDVDIVELKPCSNEVHRRVLPIFGMAHILREFPVVVPINLTVHEDGVMYRGAWFTNKEQALECAADDLGLSRMQVQ